MVEGIALAFGVQPLVLALVSLGAAALVLARDFNSPVHRAFGLFLVLQGVAAATRLSGLSDPQAAAYAARVTPYFVLASAPTLFAGVVLSFGARLDAPVRRGLVAALALAALALLAIYIADHAWWTGGPLPVAVGLVVALSAPAAYLYARDAARSSGPARRAPVRLALGFALPVFFAGGTLPLSLFSFFAALFSPFGSFAILGFEVALAFFAIQVLLLAVLLGVVLQLVRAARADAREGVPRGRAWRPLALALVAVLSGLTVGFVTLALLAAPDLGALEGLLLLNSASFAVWQLALPVALALVFGRRPHDPGEGSRAGAASEPA